MDGTGHLVKEIRFLEPAPFLLTRSEEGMESIRVLLIFVRRLNKIQRKWENGAPVFTYHRFWSQVDMATAYAEYHRLIN
ncbi:hypothetical protein CGLO_11136 [Colletotrichum gloeosporioides Cg-14]|uniref:Uncharacterized protein n=1 Tax=Colletotrichum gloeosporioides (strain Cg-14) TaxID=1237896 RepID=T0K1M4_COLGC|nr:hypothetical protein CGLO_11136 [Colletotrichum gloeosporioides Cg-14]